MRAIAKNEKIGYNSINNKIVPRIAYLFTYSFQRKAVFGVSKKINEKFLIAYAELDKAFCIKLGVSAGGVTEYINRLGNTRFAPRRDEVLPVLVKYRNIRNLFAHEPGTIRKNDDLTKADLVWIKKFSRDLDKKKDPISAYLKKARRYARNRRIRRYIVAGAVVLAVFVAVVAYFVLK